MLYDVFSVGDRVVIDIPQGHRELGCTPRPNGTLATIVSFGTVYYGRVGNGGHKPGVYVNKEWAIVRDDLGDLEINTIFLALADEAAYQRRIASWRRQPRRGVQGAATRIGNLPHVPFWEGDIVRYVAKYFGEVKSHGNVRKIPEVERFVVVSIDYDRIGDTRYGSPFTAYQIADQFDAGWSRFVAHNELALIERGNVWNYYHGIPLRFADMTEKANFFLMVGETEMVRNPVSQDYVWSMPQALEAIHGGVGDAMTSSGISLCFSPAPRISLVKYHDRTLGRWVAKHVLETCGALS